MSQSQLETEKKS